MTLTPAREGYYWARRKVDGAWHVLRVDDCDGVLRTERIEGALDPTVVEAMASYDFVDRIAEPSAMADYATYANACATARTDVMSELAKLPLSQVQIEALTEVFVATICAMPPWALEAIGDHKRGPVR